MSVSIDMPVGDDENSTLGDIIADKYNMETDFFGEREDIYSKKMLSYLGRLSNIQKEVLRLTIAGYLPKEIKQELHLNEKQYADCNAAIHSYRNISVLF